MTEEEDNQNELAGDDAGQAGRGRDKALHVILICIFPGAASFSKQSSITTKSYSPYPYTSHNCLLVAKSCPTLFDPMDCSPPGSSVHGISQARMLEWFARGPSQPRDRTRNFCLAGGFFTTEYLGGPHLIMP